MTPVSDTLLLLALQAIDDADARQVLQDALLENGPSVSISFTREHPGFIRNTAGLVVGHVRGDTSWHVAIDIGDERYAWTSEEPKADITAEDDARALAAVLLFREWSTSPWSVAVMSLATARARELLEQQLARGFTRAEIQLREPEFGEVRAHIAAPVPNDVLGAMRADLDRLKPIYLNVEFTSELVP